MVNKHIWQHNSHVPLSYHQLSSANSKIAVDRIIFARPNSHPPPPHERGMPLVCLEISLNSSHRWNPWWYEPWVVLPLNHNWLLGITCNKYRKKLAGKLMYHIHSLLYYEHCSKNVQIVNCTECNECLCWYTVRQ